MGLDHDRSHRHHPVSRPDNALVVNQALTFYEQNVGRLPTDTRHPRQRLPSYIRHLDFHSIRRVVCSQLHLYRQCDKPGLRREISSMGIRFAPTKHLGVARFLGMPVATVHFYGLVSLHYFSIPLLGAHGRVGPSASA